MSSDLRAAVDTILKAANASSERFGMKDIRQALEKRGHTFADSEWATGEVKDLIRQAVQRLTSPEAPKPKRDKYGAAAQRNLGTFMGMINGSSRTRPTSEDDEDEGEEDEEEEGEEEDEEEESESEVEVVKRKAKPKASTSKKASSNRASLSMESSPKGRSGKTSTKYKSTEFIESEDEGSEDDLPPSKHEDKRQKRSSSLLVEEVQPKKARKPAAPKAGEAAKGTVEEEARIKSIKGLLAAAGNTHPFTTKTGSEKLLSVPARNAVLEGLLSDVGLLGANGKLPSLAKATKVGEELELQKEAKAISGAPKTQGLRGGKQLDGSRAKKGPSGFGDFLGNQDSDSD